MQVQGGPLPARKLAGNGPLRKNSVFENLHEKSTIVSETVYSLKKELKNLAFEAGLR